jgi:hypothetical protein
MADMTTTVNEVLISTTSDLTIELTEYEPLRSRSSEDNDEELVANPSPHDVVDDPPRRIRAVTTFLVDRSTLTKCAAASAAHHKNVFTAMLNSGFKEATQTKISINDDNTSAMTVFLRVIHHAGIDGTLAVGHEVTWLLAKICDKYNVSIALFEKWFVKWYLGKGASISEIPANELLFPCWKFNYAKGFMNATGKCVYTMKGHIMEENPTQHRELHMPQRVTRKLKISRILFRASTYSKPEQMNAAKGRLRTILHRELFRPIKDFYSYNSCSCRVLTEYKYHQALYRIKVWPLEDSWLSNSPNVVLNRLDNFHLRLPSNDCNWCNQNYDGLIQAAKRITQEYFDGLCLDCMEARKSKTKDQDTDYWKHNMLTKREWPSGCRIKHGEPTWYFSFMGRRTN